MCTSLAMPLCDVPADLAERHHGMVFLREGMPEMQFHLWFRPALLPVRWEGRLRFLPWGSKRRGDAIPYGPWIPEDLIESGSFAHVQVERAIVPVSLGCDRGTWFLIEDGIWAAVLPDAAGGPVAYMLTQPSTPYYRNMTGHRERMPCLIRQTI